MTNIRYCFFDTESSHNIPNTGFTQLLEITAILVDPKNFDDQSFVDVNQFTPTPNSIATVLRCSQDVLVQILIGVSHIP